MANYIDLTGKTFGKLKVLSKGNGRKTKGGHYKVTWKCVCECGNEVEIDGEKLRKGHTTSCGCLKKENKGSKFIDLTGQTFNRLTVISFIPQSERTTRGYDWLCKCKCGNIVKANSYKLKQGLQKSCGCLKEEYKLKIGDLNRKYKYSNKRLYSVYKAMLDRCYNKSNGRYNNYGKRGIRVCDEWIGEKGYDNFSEWALNNGFNPKAKHGDCTLDRINTNGNYSPSNCRWINNLAQQNNRRDCRYITYNKETHTIAEWSRLLNISYSTLYGGLMRYGKSISDYIK